MVKPQNNQSLAKPLRNVWISPNKDSSDIKSFNDKEFKSSSSHYEHQSPKNQTRL